MTEQVLKIKNLTLELGNYYNGRKKKEDVYLRIAIDNKDKYIDLKGEVEIYGIIDIVLDFYEPLLKRKQGVRIGGGYDIGEQITLLIDWDKNKKCYITIIREAFGEETEEYEVELEEEEVRQILDWLYLNL